MGTDARSPDVAAVRRPTAPGYAYSALSVTVLLLLTTLALTAKQPPPPSIAEIAPEAVAQIKDAPSEQSSAFGNGANGSGDGDGSAPTTTTTTTTPPSQTDRGEIQLPKVHNCIAGRQIEDPQSPPCVPYWDADNGGVTSPGVTANEIRIGVADPPPASAPTMFTDLEAFFNKRFEFYGRKLKLVTVPGSGTDEPAQRAQARAAQEQSHVFAALMRGSGSGYYYYDELANRKIISAPNRPMFSSAELAHYHPYIWNYQMATDRLFSLYGEWICRRLGQTEAAFAGNPTLRSKTRVYGLVFGTEDRDSAVGGTGPLESVLSGCGITIKQRTSYSGYANSGLATAMAGMNNAGVTSVICLCHVVQLNSLQKAAESQGYLPEWLVNSYLFNDSNGYQHTFNASDSSNSMAATFGISVLPMQRRTEDHPSEWAIREVNPGYTPPASVYLSLQDQQYQSLLLIASGIQMAGPHLTPESFAAGLQNARFPNPEHRIMAGKVGFSGKSHSMTLDAAEIWWSRAAQAPQADDGAGAWCYVDHGARHAAGTWPTGSAGLFSQPCDSGLG
jgi:hypothetical protein